MIVTSEKFSQRTLAGFDNSISSLESVDGHSRSGSLVGLMKSQSSLDHAHVNHSPLLDNEKALTTNGTCGQRCSELSRNCDHPWWQASKWQERLATHGSMEFKLTWRKKATPAGLQMYRLAASTPRTSGSGSTGVAFGWMTPTSLSFKDSHQPGNNRYMNSVTGLMSGWNTPRATDGTHGGPNQSGGSLPADAALTAWPSPQARDWKSGAVSEKTANKNSRPLNEQVEQLMAWDTPQQSWASAGAASRSGTRKDEQLTPGLIRSSFGAATGIRGVLNPAFSRWLMGFPENWDHYSPNWNEWEWIQSVLSRQCETPDLVWQELAKTALVDLSASEMPLSLP